ncbi:MAG: hypothetical protein V2A62_00330 [Candidatus Woesearchaeota archaeon]
MEEGIYQREYDFGSEVRKRDAYLGVVRAEHNLTAAIELEKVGEEYRPHRPEGREIVYIVELPLDRTGRSELFRKGVISSPEFLTKIEGGLERTTEDLYQLARKKVETMRYLHLIP